MAFTGTVQKCKNCDKVVHFIDMVTAQGASYHKTCFRCSSCNGQLSSEVAYGLQLERELRPPDHVNKHLRHWAATLVMGNYSSLEGVLYCQPHFEQHCKESGSYSKKVQPSGKPNELTRTPSKLSSFFSGTQEKCRACNKTVYPLEKVTVEGEFYHKLCFRCARGGCKLTTSSYAALDGFLYCKPHFAQLFKEKGSYSHLTKTVSGKKTSETPPPETTQDE